MTDKKACPQTDRIADLCIGISDKKSVSEFRKHLKKCPRCRKEFQAVQSLGNVLETRHRPAPPDPVRTAYETRLHRLFPAEPVWARMADAFRLPSARRKPGFYLGLAGATAALLIGMLIGRYVWAPEPSLTHGRLAASETRSVQLDYRMISQFLDQSEIWLLEMASSTSGEGASAMDLETDREIAKTLLAKTPLIGRKAEDLDHDMLIVFLNRLEMVLLETSGAGENDLSRAFEEIRHTIRENALLQEIRRVRQSIPVPPPERA